MMEFITPPSYGTSTVNIAGIAKDGEVITAGTKGTATHTASKMDEVTDWPEPTSADFVWNGTTKDGKVVEATIGGSLGDRLDRVDVMTEVPAFIKKIAGGVAGTRPYIYQVCFKSTRLQPWRRVLTSNNSRTVLQEDGTQAEDRR